MSTVATKLLGGWSEPELNDAFNRVANPHDWRAPIDCMLRVDEAELDKIRYAIEFYTATSAKVTRIGHRTWHVQATGYRNGPAGP